LPASDEHFDDTLGLASVGKPEVDHIADKRANEGLPHLLHSLSFPHPSSYCTLNFSTGPAPGFGLSGHSKCLLHPIPARPLLPVACSSAGPVLSLTPESTTSHAMCGHVSKGLPLPTLLSQCANIAALDTHEKPYRCDSCGKQFHRL